MYAFKITVNNNHDYSRASIDYGLAFDNNNKKKSELDTCHSHIHIYTDHVPTVNIVY